MAEDEINKAAEYEVNKAEEKNESRFRWASVASVRVNS
jgi:hypothetical protein